MTEQVQAPPTSIQNSKRKNIVPTLYVVLGVIVALALVALTVWGVIALSNNFAVEVQVVRDLFIIALALESCVFGIVLILMLIMLIRLVNTVEFEIKPILQKTNETVGMVRGTTDFVSQNVVKPSITASSYIAGVRRGVKTLLGDSRRNLPD
jgi:hypothetical protein